MDLNLRIYLAARQASPRFLRINLTYIRENLMYSGKFPVYLWSAW